MSYILDALRRAESERKRGTVPNLHTTTVTDLPVADEPGGEDRRTGLSWPALVLGMVCMATLAAGGTWWLLRGGGASAVQPAQAVTLAPMAATGNSAAPVVAQPPALSPVVPAVRERSAAPARPVASAPTPQASLPARADGARKTAAPALPSPAPSPATPPLAAAFSAGQTTAGAGGTAHAAVPQPAPAVVLSLNDLPAAVRAQLPSLHVSGATHSANRHYRMAIVNGQVLHEGDTAAPGLVLELIEPGRTVWSFSGYRYALSGQ